MVIDLRSDTLTKPTPEMRRAMAEAEVGDDVYGEDPTINRLQEKAAALMGKEAALFVPSGSMGNCVSLMSQSAPGAEVICEATSHVYKYELGSMSTFGGLLPGWSPACAAGWIRRTSKRPFNPRSTTSAPPR
jgi:threonine aldolase